MPKLATAEAAARTVAEHMQLQPARKFRLNITTVKVATLVALVLVISVDLASAEILTRFLCVPPPDHNGKPSVKVDVGHWRTVAVFNSDDQCEHVRRVLRAAGETDVGGAMATQIRLKVVNDLNLDQAPVWAGDEYLRLAVCVNPLGPFGKPPPQARLIWRRVWYLMSPPVIAGAGTYKIGEDLRYWSMACSPGGPPPFPAEICRSTPDGQFNTKADCDKARNQYVADPNNNPAYRGESDPVRRAEMAAVKIVAECVSNHDPRLKY
jgi:hypothetical protein